MSFPARVLLRHADGSRTPVDPDEVYLLEADGDETWVRMRAADELIDVRMLGELLQMFNDHSVVRIHRSYAVNIGKIRHVRPRESEGWEVKLDPRVNRALPVSESRATDLWTAFGERGGEIGAVISDSLPRVPKVGTRCGWAYG